MNLPPWPVNWKTKQSCRVFVKFAKDIRNPLWLGVMRSFLGGLLALFDFPVWLDSCGCASEQMTEIFVCRVYVEP